jgi:hypothetical protein
MNGCRCGCCGQPTREDRIRWLEGHQRSLEQRMAEVAEELSRLREGAQSAS